VSALIVHSNSTAAMWEAFLVARDMPLDTPCSLVEFGNAREMRDDLAALVIAGSKRATTSLLRWYGAGGERYPLAGDYFIVVDSQKVAACVCRMTNVQERAFADVDEAYAHIEGEGDCTLATWHRDHRAFFEAEAAANGFIFDVLTHVVLETFAVVWPPAIADTLGP
jgi:uncharacterized protein YhfF